MSLQLAMIANLWLVVAYISIAYCLLKPVFVQAHMQPAFAVTVVNIKIGNTMISYGRKKDYYAS